VTAAEAIRDLIAPLLPGFEFAFGRLAGMPDPLKRYAVLRPAGGGGGDLVRRPQFTLDLIGLPGGDALETGATVEKVLLALRNSAGGLVFLAPGEPSFTTSAEGRPIFTVAVAAITETEPA
jgi:hypothetical protein